MDSVPKKVNVLMPVDRSEHAEKAYEFYVKHLHVPENYLILVNCPEILQAAHTGSMAFSPGAWSELWAREQVEVRALQHQYEKKLKSDKVHGKWLTVNYGGKPGEAIVRLAEDEKASIIVMGSRGLSTVRRTFLGSVSDYVIHHAHIPVCVCRS